MLISLAMCLEHEELFLFTCLRVTMHIYTEYEFRFLSASYRNKHNVCTPDFMFLSHDQIL